LIQNNSEWSLSVAARNRNVADAQSRVNFDAQSVRTSGASDAGYLRPNAGSVRRTQDRTFQRTLAENGRRKVSYCKIRKLTERSESPNTEQFDCMPAAGLRYAHRGRLARWQMAGVRKDRTCWDNGIDFRTGFRAAFGRSAPIGSGRQEIARFPRGPAAPPSRSVSYNVRWNVRSCVRLTEPAFGLKQTASSHPDSLS